ncbi:hypothetical protein D9619_009395 [Psilocybe cf. subviscida]|uniref:DUF6534 domain-containing protein n=1 Tax=Psilocybe cf. subviscida TaxID=2480587 RepID=A0A8H5BTX9_9AGAR|nr:hypothetical protein D9619_009395 [Psilocybe cf. subviscida]
MATNSTLPAIIPPGFAVTAASRLYGSLFNWLFFGILSVQTYVYNVNFPDDKVWSKAIVYGTYLLEAIQTGMNGADMYFWFATGFSNISHMNNVNITPADVPILCGLVASVVQLFFAYRIYTLRRGYWTICCLIIITSLFQLAGAIGNGYRSFKVQEFSEFHDNIIFPQSMHVWLVGDVVCDILIAGTMLTLFFVSRRENTAQGNRILKNLVRLIVETNTLTAGMALISYICYAALPDSPVFTCTTQIMGKLYSNTLLVTFNNRIILRKAFSSRRSIPLDPSQLQGPFNHKANDTTYYVDSSFASSSSRETYDLGTGPFQAGKV